MDIVELLRERAKKLQDFGPDAYGDADLDDRTADEIERLREDKRMASQLMREFLEKINRLRRGLHRIASIEIDPDFGTLPISDAQKIAQDALEDE